MTAIFFVVFVDLVGFGVIIPLLPFYAEHFDATPTEVGFLMAAYSLGQFVTAPLWGRLSDRIGRRIVLLISLAALAGSYIWLAYAETLTTLFLARILAGAMAGHIAAAFAYVADITTPQNRARGMGLVGAAFSLGFIFGPAIGGILAGNDPNNPDFASPAFVAAALSVAAWLLTFFTIHDVKRAETTSTDENSTLPTSFRSMLADPTIRLILMLTFLATFVFAGMESVFAMWSRREFGWGPEQNGYVFAFVGIMAALVQGRYVGRLAQRFGEHRLVIVGATLLAVGLFSLPLIPSLVGLGFALAAIAIGFGMMSPTMSSMLSHQAAPGSQGALMGLGRSTTTLARIAGPGTAGIVFHFMGKDWPFYLGAIILIAVVCIAASNRVGQASQSASPPP
jgi:DHA1 family tetracycline resistance protein-like MFS transporter